MTEKNFFSEEASRQILSRIANVFGDPDLCDAVFVVGDQKEEICTPSQFMAVASPFFKDMFYPPSGNRKEIPDMEAHIFRKVIDYLFRGRVPLNSIEDAWKVKLAGRQFQLKDLEDLCSKFLKYRLDADNLITFLRNTHKYDAPDIREVVLNRFSKDANNVVASEQMLDLSEAEMLSLLETEATMSASKIMEVLIKWSRKRYGLDPVPSAPEAKKPRIEMDENGQPVEKPAEGAEGAEENKGEPEKEPEPEVNLIKPQKPFIKFIKWEKADGDFFLKTVRGKKIMTTEDENNAMVQMLESFVEAEPLKITPKVTPVRAGPKSRKRY